MSFNWLGIVRVGSYLTFRRFIMNEVRSARKRLDTIDYELGQIGKCGIQWEVEDLPEGGTRVTERRLGFYVSAGSSLERLLQAYIAQGGNPFDISMFLDPRTSGWDLDEGGMLVSYPTQPGGGLAWPMSRQEMAYREGGMTDRDLGGQLNLLKNPKLRMTNETPWTASRQTEVKVHRARKWANQAIRDKRNNLEWRILKLMDLREQLEQERDLIMAAVGNFLIGMSGPEDVPDSETLVGIIETIDSQFLAFDEETGEVLGVNMNHLERGVYDYLMTDYEEEAWTGL